MKQKQRLTICLLFLASSLIFTIGCSDTISENSSQASDALLQFPNRDWMADGHLQQAGPIGTNLAGKTIQWQKDLNLRTGFSPLQPILFPHSDCSNYPSQAEIADSLDNTDLVLQDDLGRVPYFVTQSESKLACVAYPMRLMQGTVTAKFTGLDLPKPDIGSDTLRFTVGTSKERSQTMRAAADATYTWLADSSTNLKLQRIQGDHYILENDDTLAAYTGTVDVPNYINADRRIEWLDGKPRQHGTVEEFFHIYVPHSITQNTLAPIVQYGHGLFGDPEEIWYSSQGAIRNEVAGIFGAIAWGMSVRYFSNAAAPLWDPNHFGILQDRNIQSIVNKLVFGRVLRDQIAPKIATELGLTIATELDYVGISQGGILGSPLMATSRDIRRAVMHVGGGSWTPMMTHSSNWQSDDSAGYGDIVRATIQSPEQRALLYALWQNFWDFWDPAVFAPYWTHTPLGSALHKDRKIYYPYALDDPQVPNFSSELVMRSANIPLLGTVLRDAPQIEALDHGSSLPAVIASQWDVGGGQPAHSDVRKLPEFAEQVAEFVNHGKLINNCGNKGCQFLP